MLIYVVVAIVAIVCAFVILIWLKRRNRVQGPFSIVLFRSLPHTLSEDFIRAAYVRAFGTQPELTKIALPDGKGTAFVTASPQVPPIGVVLASGKYLSDEESAEAARSFEHPAAREAITNHTCWVGVDAMGLDHAPAEHLGTVHLPLAKLAAEFYDDNCSLLMLRATNRIAAPGDYVEVKLKQGRLDELFGDERLHAPMFHVEADDAAIERAKDEARKRLPEFLHQCRTRGIDAKPLFKAGFPTTSDSREFIWLSFSAFQGNDLVGIIENEPIDPAVPRKGASVVVTLPDIIDWAYVDEHDQPVGIFVDRVLMNRSRS
ncbi:MAG: DUF2314 domain-containing protein [Phycisphaerae bacterium]|nr:DUF2314 domain-containing protein [Phycisphaerae bacterium]